MSTSGTGNKDHQDVIEAEFTEVPAGAADTSEASIKVDGVANDNSSDDVQQEAPTRTVEEALQVLKYEDLDEERKEVVDAIIETINPFDLETIFSLGDEVVQEHTALLQRLVEAQDEQGGFFDRFKSVTTANSEAEEAIQGVFARAKNLATSTANGAVEAAGALKSIGQFLMLPINKIVGMTRKNKKEKALGAGAKEYRDAKNADQTRFANRHTIAKELEEDILRAATEKAKIVKNLKEIQEALPTLRISYEELVASQVELFDRIENFIIAGDEAARRIREEHLPAYLEQGRTSQAKRNEAEDLSNALDILNEKVFNLKGFRHSAVSDGVSFQARKKNLGRVESQLRAQLVNMETVQGRLVKLRTALTGAKIEELIAEAAHFETRLINQDTSLNNSLALMFQNSNEDITDRTAALAENLTSHKRVIARQYQATKERRLVLETAKGDLAALTQQTAVLAIASEKDMERVVAEIDAIDAAKGQKSGVAKLGWKKPGTTGTTPKPTALLNGTKPSKPSLSLGASGPKTPKP